MGAAPHDAFELDRQTSGASAAATSADPDSRAKARAASSLTARHLYTDILELGFEAAAAASEAQAVATLRTLGLFGLWPLPERERATMIVEKPPALAASALAATFTIMGGQRPDRVLAAALQPIRIETNKNAARLVRRST